MMIPPINLQAATSTAKQAANPVTEKRLRDLKRATEQFEAVFTKQLVSEMRKGIKSTMGDQPGRAIYQDMMDQAIGDSMAHQGALGIGQLLYKQFAKQVAGGSMPPVFTPAGTAGTSAIERKKDK